MRIAKSVCAAIVVALAAACSPPAEQKAEAPATAAPAVEAPAAPAATPVALEIKDKAGVQLTGDAVAGERVFAQCKSCHALGAGVNKVGPTLHGVIGREAGAVEGFGYSQANKDSHLVWSEQELYDYLENPRAKVPGTIMAYVGLRDSQQRADLIAYLKGATAP